MTKSLEQALAKISDLEEKIEDQQILIDALINKIKSSSKAQCVVTEVDEVRCLEFGVPIEDEAVCELRKMEDVKKKKHTDHNMSLDGEVEDIFRSKNMSRSLKGEINIESFIKHARECHSFSLSSRTDVDIKGSIVTYIRENINKILRRMISNLNIYDLNVICSAFNMISGETDYQCKLVIAHDIILFTEDLSRMPFMISALFNNQDIHDDAVGKTLKKILAHQHSVDCDIYRSFPNLINCYNRIIENFEVQPNERSLESSCGELIGDFEVFEDGVFNQVVLPNMYAIRMLSHYLDWDFTYNRFIRNVLYPKLRKKDKPLYAVYILAVTFNALRVFGYIESVDLVLEMFEELMIDSSEVSIVIYLFIKQINPGKARQWLNTYAKDINHVDAAYIEDLLLY